MTAIATSSANPHATWILVADGKQAQVYAQEKVAHVMALTGNATRGPSNVVQIREPVLIEGMKSKDEHFAVTLAGQLNEAQEKKRFDQLVLVAPAKMLSEIKKHLSKGATKSIVAELHKELTHCNAHELAGHLQDILHPAA